MNIKKRIQEESIKAFPIINNVKGNDCNERKRQDWINACNKGVEIMKEFMETLKDFDAWKDWKNTDPIDEVEWDDSHELNNVLNKILEDLDTWEEVTNGATYYDILDKTQKLEPIDWGNSLHCHHSDFLIDDNIYRLTWTIGGANNEEPIIERKIK